MPTTLPTGRSGRLVALGILGVVLILLLYGFIVPLADLWNDLDDELDALSLRAHGYEQLVQRRAAIERQLVDLRAGMETAPDYLAVAEPAVAAAEAQARVSALAESAGAIVRSTNTTPPVSADGFTAINFQISVSGPLHAIRDLLYAVDSGQPRLVIDRLTVGPSQQQGAAPGDLDLALDLHGYMVGEVEQ